MQVNIKQNFPPHHKCLQIITQNYKKNVTKKPVICASKYNVPNNKLYLSLTYLFSVIKNKNGENTNSNKC